MRVEVRDKNGICLCSNQSTAIGRCYVLCTIYLLCRWRVECTTRWLNYTVTVTTMEKNRVRISGLCALSIYMNDDEQQSLFFVLDDCCAFIPILTQAWSMYTAFCQCTLTPSYLSCFRAYHGNQACAHSTNEASNNMTGTDHCHVECRYDRNASIVRYYPCWNEWCPRWASDDDARSIHHFV